MTIGERERKDRMFRSMSKAAKFVRRNISKKLGEAIQDMIDDAWSESFDR